MQVFKTDKLLQARPEQVLQVLEEVLKDLGWKTIDVYPSAFSLTAELFELPQSSKGVFVTVATCAARSRESTELLLSIIAENEVSAEETGTLIMSHVVQDLETKQCMEKKDLANVEAESMIEVPAGTGQATATDKSLVLRWVENACHFIHRHFLPILMVAYLLAGVMPGIGVWLRQIKFGTVHWPDGSAVTISPSLIMLSFLLFNAGLGIQTKELVHIRKKPMALLSGFVANMAVPLLLVVALGGIMHQWHDADELQNLLVGLALIVAMPIAGSSAAWSQNANGNLSLSLGLVLLSTVLSPLTTPMIMNVFSCLTTGDYSSDLRELAAQGTNAFMMLTVVLPSLLGVITHFIMGDRMTVQVKPYMKLINFIFLLLLNYSNGSTALPEAFRKPDPDFLAFILTTTTVMCTATFAAGWLISKWLKTDSADKAALMFGLGMNNNGTGLVLAAATLSDHPAVMLPMIFYTLVQQVIAALVDWKLFRNVE